MCIPFAFGRVIAYHYFSLSLFFTRSSIQPRILSLFYYSIPCEFNQRMIRFIRYIGNKNVQTTYTRYTHTHRECTTNENANRPRIRWQDFSGRNAFSVWILLRSTIFLLDVYFFYFILLWWVLLLLLFIHVRIEYEEYILEWLTHHAFHWKWKWNNETDGRIIPLKRKTILDFSPNKWHTHTHTHLLTHSVSPAILSTAFSGKHSLPLCWQRECLVLGFCVYTQQSQRTDIPK